MYRLKVDDAVGGFHHPDHCIDDQIEELVDACEQAAAEREQYAADLQAQCDGLEEDPLLVALGNARAAKEAADREIRLLLAYGREFHGERPYKLEPLAQASGYTVSGIRTAYTDQDVAAVSRGIERQPNSRRYQSREDTDPT
ncbi:hypothetical protein [Streptomyces sp. NPDC002676]